MLTMNLGIAELSWALSISVCGSVGDCKLWGSLQLMRPWKVGRWVAIPDVIGTCDRYERVFVLFVAGRVVVAIGI